MNSIQLMVDEHKNIKRMLKVVRKVCYGILQGGDINYHDFEEIIDFIRNYADKHHHGKEEKFLFNQMLQHLGSVGEKLIRGGMLVEHDLGRFYIQELEVALEKVRQGDEESKLDVIANAVGYTHLLDRHIGKEDEVVYTFAERQLPSEVLEQVHQLCTMFEEEATHHNIQNHYRKLLAKLEEKYGL